MAGIRFLFKTKMSLTIKLVIVFAIIVAILSGYIFYANLQVKKVNSLSLKPKLVKQNVFNKFAIATANPYATEVGAQVIENGGNAIDAAVAVQLVLTLVEPEASGIGGGAFLMFHHDKENKLYSFDARETAPETANEDLFLNNNGMPMQFFKALAGGRAVGTPGIIKLLHEIHQKFGKLPWRVLFQGAISLAEYGFYPNTKLVDAVQKAINPAINKFKDTKNYFENISVDKKLINHKYANILRVLQDNPDSFYKGDLAKRIINKVQKAENKGQLSLSDLGKYEVKTRQNLCAYYKKERNNGKGSLYKLCSIGPPSSGGLTVLQTLLINKAKQELVKKSSNINHINKYHNYIESLKLSYADRNLYIADEDFVFVPKKHLLNYKYLKHRAMQIGDFATSEPKLAGNPLMFKVDSSDQYSNIANEIYNLRWQLAPSEAKENGTSHFSIIDKEGNAVSMTSSIEMAFGSGLMVDGFLLNNQLTDFDFISTKKSKKVANQVEGGKRPRSSMAPFIIYKQNSQGEFKLYLLVGSPGGSRIINYVARIIYQVLEHEMDLIQAINSPHLVNRNNIFTEVESNLDLATKKIIEQLKAKGHQFKFTELNSGINAILVQDNNSTKGSSYLAVADKRRDGSVAGK